MSRINALVAEHCPEGVPFAELNQLAAYSHTRIDATEVNEANFVGVDNLLQNMAGKTDATYAANTRRLTAYIDGDVLIGNIRPYLKKIWLSDRNGGCSGDVLAIRIFEKRRIEIIPEFLYRLLASDDFFDYNMQHAKGAKMPRGDKDAILRYRVPVPPLDIQREIVAILDQFTKLEAELEAELEARRRQYQYYRDTLLSVTYLTNNEGSNHATSILTLGDVGVFVRGSGIQKSDFVDAGAGCIHYGQIHTHYGTWAKSTKSFISPDLAVRSRKAHKGDLIIATTSEDDDAVAKAVAWLGDESVAVSTDAYIYRHTLNPKYVSYFFQTEHFQSQKRPHVTGTKVRRISGDSMAKIKIPVPPMDEQERIVAILDRFDELTSSLSTGLPAEIAARRRQYAYYRDQLLTFKEAA